MRVLGCERWQCFPLFYKKLNSFYKKIVPQNGAHYSLLLAGIEEVSLGDLRFATSTLRFVTFLSHALVGVCVFAALLTTLTLLVRVADLVVVADAVFLALVGVLFAAAFVRAISTGVFFSGQVRGERRVGMDAKLKFTFDVDLTVGTNGCAEVVAVITTGFGDLSVA